MKVVRVGVLYNENLPTKENVLILELSSAVRHLFRCDLIVVHEDSPFCDLVYDTEKHLAIVDAGPVVRTSVGVVCGLVHYYNQGQFSAEHAMLP